MLTQLGMWTGASLLIMSGLLLRLRAVRQRPACPQCNYSLASLPYYAGKVMCPECGGHFAEGATLRHRPPRKAVVVIAALGTLMMGAAVVQWYRSYQWLQRLEPERLIWVAGHLGKYDDHVLKGATDLLYARAMSSFYVSSKGFASLQTLLPKAVISDHGAAIMLLQLIGAGTTDRTDGGDVIRVSVFSIWTTDPSRGHALAVPASDAFLRVLCDCLCGSDRSLCNHALATLMHINVEDARRVAEMLLRRAATQADDDACWAMGMIAVCRPSIAEDATWWEEASRICDPSILNGSAVK